MEIKWRIAPLLIFADMKVLAIMASATSFRNCFHLVPGFLYLEWITYDVIYGMKWLSDLQLLFQSRIPLTLHSHSTIWMHLLSYLKRPEEAIWNEVCWSRNPQCAAQSPEAQKKTTKMEWVYGNGRRGRGLEPAIYAFSWPKIILQLMDGNASKCPTGLYISRVNDHTFHPVNFFSSFDLDAQGQVRIERLYGKPVHCARPALIKQCTNPIKNSTPAEEYFKSLDSLRCGHENERWEAKDLGCLRAGIAVHDGVSLQRRFERWEDSLGSEGVQAGAAEEEFPLVVYC